MKALFALTILMMTACSHTWIASTDFEYGQHRQMQEAQFLASLQTDSDRDGISDHWDQCTETPKQIQVNAQGCPLDRNGNGLPDFQETKARELVKHPVMNVDAYDETQSSQEGMVLLYSLQGFTSESQSMTEEMMQRFEELVSEINAATDIVAIELTGHTDDQGSTAFNYQLALKRAQILAGSLQAKLTRDLQVMVRAMGELQPIADNAHAEGRITNRRVEIHALYKK